MSDDRFREVKKMRPCDGLCLVCGRVLEPHETCLHDYPLPTDEFGNPMPYALTEWWK